MSAAAGAAWSATAREGAKGAADRDRDLGRGAGGGTSGTVPAAAGRPSSSASSDGQPRATGSLRSHGPRRLERTRRYEAP